MDREGYVVAGSRMISFVVVVVVGLGEVIGVGIAFGKRRRRRGKLFLKRMKEELRVEKVEKEEKKKRIGLCYGDRGCGFSSEVYCVRWKRHQKLASIDASESSNPRPFPSQSPNLGFHYYHNPVGKLCEFHLPHRTSHC